MKCPGCEAENDQARRYCRQCGSKLAAVCSECGFENCLGDRFCGGCGNDLGKPVETAHIDYSHPPSYTPKFLAHKILTTRSTIEGERKLVTVLFADVANFTAMSEKLDPEEVHQVMDGCFKVLMDEVHRFEGTVNQFTGDGVMALFGAPLAHEDHAQRACHVALVVQRAMEAYGEKVKSTYGVEFKMRIGLNSGPVIVGSIGDDLRMDYTAVGDTTNLAFRMQSIAKPGTISVAGNTHKLVRDFFEFEFLGKLPLKGKERLQETYELVRATKVETRIEALAAKGLTRFVGRRKEMQALREAFETACSGSGQIVGIVGDAGVGKSRLMLEVKNMLPSGEYAYLEGRCHHYGCSMPYLPVLDIVKSYLGIEEEDSESTIKERIRERCEESEAVQQGVPHGLHELLSLKVEEDRYLQLGPQQRRELVFEAIRDLLIRHSQKKPLILAVEDLHWIDQTSEEFLDYFIGWLPSTRILLILLYRPEYTHNWGSKSYYSKIGLEQLPTRRTMELVQALLEDGEAVPELLEFIVGKAGGNPLFVEELTHSLLENGSIHKEDNRYLLSRKASEIEVPDAIQGIIAARMDRVEENLKRTIQVASVIGREFAYRILKMVMGTREDLKSHLLNLQRSEFIYETQLFPELQYIFKHALTQEVAYNSLLLRRRKQIHERIGKAIEELYAERLEEYFELLAYHYGRSDNRQKAVEYLDLSNQKAAKAGAMEQAKAYFDKAMDLLNTLTETEESRQRRTSLLVNQNVVFELLFKWTEYYGLLVRYESLAAQVRNPGLLGAFYIRMAGCEWSFGLFDKAIQTATKAAELCEAAGMAEDVAHVNVVLECCYLWKGDFDRALASKEEALRRMEEGLNIYLYGRARCMAAMGFAFLGHWDKAIEEAEKAMTAAEDFSDNSQISIADSTLAVIYNFKGDLRRAIEHGERAVWKALTPMDKAWAEACLAWAWCRSGEPRRGIEVLAPFVQVAQIAGYVSGTFSGMVWLGQAFLLAGEYERARQTLEGLKELADRCEARHYQGWAHYLLGEVALKTSQPQAGDDFCQSIGIFRETKAENDLALAYAGYGRFHKQEGHKAESGEYLAMALEIFERLGTLSLADEVRRELAELPKEARMFHTEKALPLRG